MRRPSRRIAGPVTVNHANRECRRTERPAPCARLRGWLSGLGFWRGSDTRLRSRLFGANQFLHRCLLRYRRLCRGLLRDGFRLGRSARIRDRTGAINQKLRPVFGTSQPRRSPSVSEVAPLSGSR